MASVANTVQSMLPIFTVRVCSRRTNNCRCSSTKQTGAINKFWTLCANFLATQRTTAYSRLPRCRLPEQRRQQFPKRPNDLLGWRKENVQGRFRFYDRLWITQDKACGSFHYRLGTYSFTKCVGTCQFLRGLWMDISAARVAIHMRTDANNRVTTASTTRLPEQKKRCTWSRCWERNIAQDRLMT